MQKTVSLINDAAILNGRSRRTVVFHNVATMQRLFWTRQDGHFKGILYYSREKSKNVRHIGMQEAEREGGGRGREREWARCSPTPYILVSFY